MSLTLSGVTAAVQCALQNPAGIFSHQTTAAQARQELDGLANTLASLTSRLQANTSVSITTSLSNIPQGLAVALSFTKATSAVKNVAKPISSVDATSLLNSYRVVQTKTLDFAAFYKTRSSAYEGVVPGILKYGLTTLQQLFNSLSSALASVDPSSIPPSEIQGLQATVTSAIAV